MHVSVNRDEIIQYIYIYIHTYIYIYVYIHTCVCVCVCNFPKDHTLPVSFIFLLESSQRCYVHERGLCPRGKSDWSQGPRRAAVLPLSLFLLFLNKHSNQKTNSWVIGIQGRGSHRAWAGQQLTSQNIAWGSRLDILQTRCSVEQGLPCKGFDLFSSEGFKTTLNPWLMF